MWTDNAWVFTLKYTKWRNQKQSPLDQVLAGWEMIHALIPKGQPWKNGLVERSHRTDNENLFDTMEFSNSEERRYYFWLWERWYNFDRPHQGLDGKTPVEKFRELFPLHARCMLS